MRLTHTFMSLAAAFALALLPQTPVFAQEGIVPLSPVVEVDETCTYALSTLETEGQVIAVWYNGIFPGEIRARTGSSLGELGPEVLLATVNVAGDATAGFAPSLQVVAQPGGFVVAWTTTGMANAYYQRFGLNLAPLAPAVLAGAARGDATPALLADSSGVVTIAFFDPADTVKWRRYSAADVPLTPLLDSDPTLLAGTQAAVRLAAGDAGLLVAWSGAPAGESPRLSVRAFDGSGMALGPSQNIAPLGASDFDVAWAQGFYLAVRPFGQILGRQIAENGAPLGPEFPLTSTGAPYDLHLSSAADALWLTFADGEQGILGTRIELPSLAVEPPNQLVPRPLEEFELIDPTATFSTAEGVLLSWRYGQIANILPPPCLDGLAVRTRLFGPARGVVDVPALTSPGLWVFALLLAIGALWGLRRA